MGTKRYQDPHPPSRYKTLNPCVIMWTVDSSRQMEISLYHSLSGIVYGETSVNPPSYRSTRYAFVYYVMLQQYHIIEGVVFLPG